MQEGMLDGLARSRHVVKIVASAVAGVVCLAVVVALVWISWPRSQSLLPDSSRAAIKDFTPYFYDKSVPAGYTFNQSQVSVRSDLLMVPLAKPGGADVSITEQAMPSNLSEDSLFNGGQGAPPDKAPVPVKDAAGRAVINDIEGRLVGIMVTPGSKRTLVIINAPGSADKNDITALLQGLHAL